MLLYCTLLHFTKGGQYYASLHLLAHFLIGMFLIRLANFQV
jgi:hypothetical protein